MRKMLLATFLMLLFAQAFSQVGNIDVSFGNNGVSDTISTDVGFLAKILVQPDGKIIATGNRNDGDIELNHHFLARYKMDGTLDKTFGRNGIVIENEMKVGYGSILALQKDGKILIADELFVEDAEDPRKSYADIVMIRYTKNGARDTSFGVNGKVITDVGRKSTKGDYLVGTNDIPTSIAIDSDGTILVGAQVYDENNNYNSGIRAALIRYNTDGSVAKIQRYFKGFASIVGGINVTTYDDGGYVFSGIVDFHSIVVFSSRFGKRIVQHPQIDMTAFSTNRKHHILSNGKVAVVRDNLFSSKSLSYIALLTADGQPDSSFSNDGFVEFKQSADFITSEPNGKIIAGSTRFMRFNADGTIDPTFKDNSTTVSKKDDIAVYGNRLYALQGYGAGHETNRITAYILNTDDRYVKVNLYGNSDPYSNREWNNWNNLKNLHFNTFYYSDSTASGISAVMSNRNGINDNGTNYGSGIAPAGVLRHSSYAIGSRTVTLSGLSPNKKYSIELYGSRDAYSDNSTVYTINGVSKTIATYKNFTNKALFTNLTFNTQGQIVVTISSTKTYNYLNGFVIRESSTTSAQSTQVTTMAKHNNDAVVSSELQLTAYPNPARQSFTLQLKNSSANPAQLQVFDAGGRMIETKQNFYSNTSVIVGGSYKPGVYYVQIIQGTEHKFIKLVKEAN